MNKKVQLKKTKDTWQAFKLCIKGSGETKNIK